jgi:hypothetical protein
LETRLNSETKQVVDRSMLQISPLKKETGSLRVGPEKAKQMFEDAVDDLKKANQKVLDAVAQKHQRELEHCIQAGNEKTNALVLQNVPREDETRKKLQREMIDLNCTATADSLTQTETLKRKVFDLENKIKGMESAAKKMNCATDRPKVEIDRMGRKTQPCTSSLIPSERSCAAVRGTLRNVLKRSQKRSRQSLINLRQTSSHL